MATGFDVVPVGIQHERTVIALVIVRPQAGWTVVSATGSERRSVLLAYYEGYTHAELARLLNAPLGTVTSWVRRGLLQQRDCLGAA